MRNRAKNRRRGFTMIEALVAIMLMAVALPPLNYGIWIAAQSAADARLRDQATELAQSKLNDIIAEQLWQNQGNPQDLSGDFSPEAPGIHWQAHAQAWPQDVSGKDIAEIDLTVTWPSRSRQNSVELSTIAYWRQPQ